MSYNGVLHFLGESMKAKTVTIEQLQKIANGANCKMYSDYGVVLDISSDVPELDAVLKKYAGTKEDLEDFNFTVGCNYVEIEDFREGIVYHLRDLFKLEGFKIIGSISESSNSGVIEYDHSTLRELIKNLNFTIDLKKIVDAQVDPKIVSFLNTRLYSISEEVTKSILEHSNKDALNEIKAHVFSALSDNLSKDPRFSMDSKSDDDGPYDSEGEWMGEVPASDEPED